MAFRGLKNFFNTNIENGVSGKGYVAGASEPLRTESGSIASSYNAEFWLDVHVEGQQPYRACVKCIAKRDKHPSPGTWVPITVDPQDPERIRIEWDEMLTDREQLAAGAPAQGDPAAQILDLSSGSAQVIDARNNPELREQVLAMLGQQGVDVSTPAAPSQDNMIAQLEKLAELRDRGVLTQAEFEAQKARLLG